MNIDIYQISHDICLAKFLKRCLLDYQDVNLTNEQLVYLYEDCFNCAEDIADIINSGTSEPIH